MATETFGPILDIWSALVMGRGDLASTLKGETQEAVAQRGLSKLTHVYGNVAKDGSSPQAQFKPAIVFRQDVGGGAIAHVCLYTEAKGTSDLEIEWWVSVINLAHKRWARNMASVNFMVSALGFLVGGLNASLGNRTLGGVGMYAASRSGSVGMEDWEQAGNPTQENVTQALALAHTVDYCLMRVLGNHDIDASQLRVTHPSSFLKIGHLANS